VIRGENPIGPEGMGDDLHPMTVMALRYPARTRGSRLLEPTKSRFGRDVRGDRETTTMVDRPTLEDIRAAVQCGTYTVDADKVADAIVERLLVGRAVRESGPAR
jgi:hypothetical protein